MFLQFNIDVNGFHHKKVTLMLKLYSKSFPFYSSTIQFTHPLWPFISFISGCNSNFLPTFQWTFQRLCHLTRGEITSSPQEFVLKWTKTLQATNTNWLIPLASVPGTPLCPLQAVHTLCVKPLLSNSPMFAYNTRQGMVTITHPQACMVLAFMLVAIWLNPSQFGFQTFKRSGASLTFFLQVPLQYI